jgi:hypothetical protein
MELENIKKKIKELSKPNKYNYEELIIIYQQLLHQYYYLKRKNNII